MPNPHILILAAGKGTRMKSARPKVLHRVAGRPMIEHVLSTAAALAPASTTVVVGHKANETQQALAGWHGVDFVLQAEQRGTAHAVLQAESALAARQGTLLLLSGDVPLLTRDTLSRLLASHDRTGAAITVLTATVERPYGYGRIVRAKGRIVRIVEERDASPTQRTIREINTGIYAFDIAPLLPALRELPAENAQGEYYLTDLVSMYRRRELGVEALLSDHPNEFRGINSRMELAEATCIVRHTKNEELMAAGVTIEDPATTYIDEDVTIGIDTVLHPGVILEGSTQIGVACEIHAGVRIVDSTLDDNVVIKNHCVIDRSHVSTGASIGPFAHLRPKTTVGPDAKVGNFVELKNMTLGAGSKANHHAYLGDATIGERANIGAGTITCNYDGRAKHQTVIEDEVFVGSDSQFVAPVTIGRGAYVAAGSTITNDVPADALGIARARQTNKLGWTVRAPRDSADSGRDKS